MRRRLHTSKSCIVYAKPIAWRYALAPRTFATVRASAALVAFSCGAKPRGGGGGGGRGDDPELSWLGR
jgi:hypothetical protein